MSKDNIITLKRYQPEYAPSWNRFVETSKNGTFLFQRQYMDYHADRFTDHSLLFYKKNKLAALLPGNVCEKTFQSHGGLTYGGFILGKDTKITDVEAMFNLLMQYLSNNGIEQVIYKCVPHIYHQLPAEEDLYWLFRHGAQLTQRSASSTLYMTHRPSYRSGRAWAVKQGKHTKVDIQETRDFAQFMDIEKAHLNQKYDTDPVHTPKEMQLLADRFPDNIRFFGGYLDDELLGGTIIYETPYVAHAQYIAATPRGFEKYVLDSVFDYLLSNRYANKRYFDFGISTEAGGNVLNTGLIHNKEGFGGRTTVYDIYTLTV